MVIYYFHLFPFVSICLLHPHSPEEEAKGRGGVAEEELGHILLQEGGRRTPTHRKGGGMVGLLLLYHQLQVEADQIRGWVFKIWKHVIIFFLLEIFIVVTAIF